MFSVPWKTDGNYQKCVSLRKKKIKKPVSNCSVPFPRMAPQTHEDLRKKPKMKQIPWCLEWF